MVSFSACGRPKTSLHVVPDAKQKTERLVLGLARTSEEIREAQRLRYRIFIAASGPLSPQNIDKVDEYAFDAYCDHLIVRDTRIIKLLALTGF